MVNRDQLRLNHTILGEMRYTDRKVEPKVTNHVRKKFTFLECEDMMVGQPRRCYNCTNCKSCSTSSQEMSRREARELSLIKENMTLTKASGKIASPTP